MLALNNAEFLALWEEGDGLHPIDRGLLAIRASLPESTGLAVADWPLGRRNQALAQLRALYFGPLLQGWTTCRQCGEKLEFELDCRTLVEHGNETHTSEPPLTVDGHAFRLPTSRDLARIADEPDPERAALRLVEQCRIDLHGEARQTEAGEPLPISPTEIEHISEHMARADPLAEIALGLQCPVCDDATEEVLDLPAFVWTEIDARARRLLFDTHTLASAYGWTEAQILSMTDVRRSTYLQMASA